MVLHGCVLCVRVKINVNLILISNSVRSMVRKVLRCAQEMEQTPMYCHAVVLASFQTNYVMP